MEGLSNAEDQREVSWDGKIASVSTEPTTPAADASNAEWDHYYFRCEQSYDLAREMRYASGWASDF